MTFKEKYEFYVRVCQKCGSCGSTQCELKKQIADMKKEMEVGICV